MMQNVYSSAVFSLFALKFYLDRVARAVKFVCQLYQYVRFYLHKTLKTSGTNIHQVVYVHLKQMQNRNA